MQSAVYVVVALVGYAALGQAVDLDLFKIYEAGSSLSFFLSFDSRVSEKSWRYYPNLPNNWMVYQGKSDYRIDDKSGYPHDLGNPQIWRFPKSLGVPP